MIFTAYSIRDKKCTPGGKIHSSGVFFVIVSDQESTPSFSFNRMNVQLCLFFVQLSGFFVQLSLSIVQLPLFSVQLSPMSKRIIFPIG